MANIKYLRCSKCGVGDTPMPVAYDVNWENSNLFCDHCNTRIESAYAEDEALQAYSNPERESDPYSLPDVEVFKLTAEEQVETDEELMWEAGKKFPLMHMNSRDRQKAIDWAVKESGATVGWFWWTCMPGCLPDSCANGPFESRKEALKDAQDTGE